MHKSNCSVYIEFDKFLREYNPDPPKPKPASSNPWGDFGDFDDFDLEAGMAGVSMNANLP